MKRKKNERNKTTEETTDLVLFRYFPDPDEEVDYGKFMQMTESRKIGQVEIQQQDNQLLFTDKKGENIYKTAMVEDPDLIDRLYASGAAFSGEITKQMSPALETLLTWILPSQDREDLTGEFRWNCRI